MINRCYLNFLRAMMRLKQLDVKRTDSQSTDYNCRGWEQLNAKWKRYRGSLSDKKRAEEVGIQGKNVKNKGPDTI